MQNASCECGADAVSWRMFSNDLVVAPWKGLYEGVPSGDGAHGDDSFQSAHWGNRDFNRASASMMLFAYWFVTCEAAATNSSSGPE